MSAERPAGRPGRKKGASLILVVWAVGLMATIGALVVRDAHLGARESRIVQDRLAAQLLMESGVRLALDRLDGPESLSGRSFPYVCDLAEGRLVMDVRPVSAFIDLNAAQEELLAALFETLGASPGLSQSLAARIADYRDADSTPRPGGAEVADYIRAGLAHGPANRPFGRTGELSEVLGMPATLLGAALPHLTVHSASTRVNPVHASAEVRAALQAFGAVVQADLDEEDWDAGMMGGLSPLSAGPVVLTVSATTPSGRTSSLTRTYGTARSAGGQMRRLIEEHDTGARVIMAAGAVLPEAVPCL